MPSAGPQGELLACGCSPCWGEACQSHTETNKPFLQAERERNLSDFFFFAFFASVLMMIKKKPNTFLFGLQKGCHFSWTLIEGLSR